MLVIYCKAPNSGKFRPLDPDGFMVDLLMYAATYPETLWVEVNEFASSLSRNNPGYLFEVRKK